MFTWRDQRFCVKIVSDWKWVGSKKCPSNMVQWSQGFCLPQNLPMPISTLTKQQSPTPNSININQPYLMGT